MSQLECLNNIDNDDDDDVQQYQQISQDEISKGYLMDDKSNDDNEQDMFRDDEDDEIDENEEEDEDDHRDVKTSKKQVVNESLNVLNWEQVKKLDDLLNYSIPIHGRGNFPTLNVTLKDFIRNLNSKLSNSDVSLKDIRINGGVASYILTSMTDYQYSDIDIIFYCTLIDDKVNNFDKIKQCVFDCLLDYLPSQTKKDKISPIHLKEAYVMKMVKVCDNDVWSLISLCNNDNQNIELKFVDKMKRQFQFSVDSFQIHLSSLLNYYDYQSSSTSTTTKAVTSCDMNHNFYPKVVAESIYGNFAEAKFHLDNKLIATKLPEEIRGGGLLKYCNLKVRGYTPADETLMKSQEKYMCSRFFIDFNDIEAQKYMLITYIASHFNADFYLRYNYLIKLFDIVSKSTVCLMNHERRLTLELISQLADSYQTQIFLQQQQQQFSNNNCQQQQQQINIQFYYPRNKSRQYSSSSSASSTSSNSSSQNKKQRYYNNRNYNYNNNNYNYYQNQHQQFPNQHHLFYNADYNQAIFNHHANTIPHTLTITNSYYISNELEIAAAATTQSASLLIARPTLLTINGDSNVNNLQNGHSCISSNSSSGSLLLSTNSSLVSSPSQSPSPSSSSTVLSVSPAPSPKPHHHQQQQIQNVNMKQCIYSNNNNETNDIYYYTNDCGSTYNTCSN